MTGILNFDHVTPTIGLGAVDVGEAVFAREYGFTDLDGSQPDCWRYMVEVQDPGHPPDPTGYR